MKKSAEEGRRTTEEKKLETNQLSLLSFYLPQKY